MKVFFAAAGLLALATSGCAGRNVHSDLKADPSLLEREWTLKTREIFEAGDHGYEYSNPVFFENTLIFGNQSVGLVSLYPGLLQVRWSLPIPGGVLSELAVGQGNIYFGGGDGFLYSVNAETGRVNWRYEVRNTTVSRPAVSGGRVIVTTSDDTVYAFDAGTGKWLWHYRRRTQQASSIHGAAEPLVDGTEVLAGLSDGFIVSLNVEDGQLKWEKKLHQGSKFTDVDGKAVLDGGNLFVPSYDGALYALKRQGGETLWRFDSGGSKQVVVEDQRVFLPSSDGNIYALSRASGKELWRFELDNGAPTQLVVTEKYIVVGSSFQYMYVIDKNTGKGLYRFNAGNGSGFSGSPAYDSNTHKIYFLSGSGNLYSFKFTQPPRVIREHASAVKPWTWN